MVFQDPYESLNPRATIFEIVAESLIVHGPARSNERTARVKTALEEAAPRRRLLPTFSHGLSGGKDMW
jgi:ABC-type microcin C transport system duplicated ATPase subunit YejF